MSFREVSGGGRDDEGDAGVGGFGGFDLEDWMKRYRRLSYRLFGGWVKRHEGEFEVLDNDLRKARLRESYDMYVSRLLLTSILVGVSTSVSVLTTLGLIGFLDFRLVEVLASPVDVLGSRYLSLVLGFSLWGVVSSLLVSVTSFVGGYSYPKYRASRRGKKIDRMLPHSTAYMYAMSHGGMNIVQIIDKLADAEDAYGEVSLEMQTARRYMDLFDKDLDTALRDLSNVTPSQQMSEFLSDLITFHDSGAELTGFLHDKSEKYLKEAEESQSKLIESIEAMGKVYVVGFVAAPIFLIVIMLSMSLLGSSKITALSAIIYLILPLGNLLFFVVVDTMSPDTAEMNRELEQERNLDLSYSEMTEEYGDIDSDSAEAIRDRKKREKWVNLLLDPIQEFLDTPSKTMFYTIPVAAMFVTLSFAFGLGGVGAGGVSIDHFLDHYYSVTAIYFVLPFLAISVPMAVFHVFKMHKKRHMMKRLPDALTQIAEQCESGMTLEDGVETTSKSTSGYLGEELEKVGNEVAWYNDLNQALISMANRVKLPIVSRTVKLVSDANYSSGDIGGILEIAARDANKRHQLARKRVHDMRMVVLVILASSMIYLLIIVILDANLLGVISDFQKNANSGFTGKAPGGVNIQNVSVESYRMLLFHSALLQGAITGVMGGYLKDNNIYTGVVYSIGMVLITMAVFLII